MGKVVGSGELEDTERRKRLDNYLEICEVYGWTLKEVRELTVYELSEVVRLQNKKRREQKRAMRKRR